MTIRERDKILLRDNDAERLKQTRQFLGKNYICLHAETTEEIHDLLNHNTIHSVVIWEDSNTPDGVFLCQEIHRLHLETKIVLVAADRDYKRLIEAFNQKCIFLCLIEPVSAEPLTSAISKAVRRFEMDRVHKMILERATEIDFNINSIPYRLYRLRMSAICFFRLIAGSTSLCILFFLILLLAGAGAFLLLYYLKSMLGIDLFENRHLKDFLQF